VMGCSLETDAAAAARPGLLAHFAALEDRFSRFLPGSELSLVNAQDGVCVLSTEFLRVLGIALQAAEVSDGLVDPTLGNALDAAGYDRDFAQLEDGPTKNSRATKCHLAAAPGGWRSVRLAGRLLARPAGVQLDLNGVVKSLAVDDAVRLLSGPGFVSAGGDLAANGPVDVALPGGDAVRLVEGGIATSGSVARRWMHAGVQRHHLIDPATGTSASSPWTQVTVVGASCVAADVCAKAAFLLGCDGPAWLDAHDLPGRFLAGERVVTNRAWDGALTRETVCT